MKRTRQIRPAAPATGRVVSRHASRRDRALVLGPVVAVVRRWLSTGDLDLAEAARTLPDRIWRSGSTARGGPSAYGPS